MSSSFQTLAALALVALAAAWLIRRAFAKRQSGCGGDCGCPATEIKASLKQKT